MRRNLAVLDRGRMVRLAVAALVIAPTPLAAQTASQIIPPSFVPQPQQRPEPSIVPQSDPAGASLPGSASAFVTPGGVETSGGTLLPETLAALRARLVGRRVSVAELFAAAAAAEAAEARAGRVLVRVVVPQQDLADGATLRLAVVEGFVERVDVARVPAGVRGRVAALLAGIAGRRDVTLGQIERRLTLANQVPGVRLRSALAAGAQPGGTVLSIEAAWRPVSAYVTADNALSDALGRQAYGFGVDFNAVLGLGELIYLRASGLPNTGRETSVLDPTPRNRALAMGGVLPLGADGLTLTVEGTDARAAPRHPATLPGFASRFRRASARLRYPVVSTRALTLAAEASLDAQDERVWIIDPAVLPLSLDELRVARATGDLSAALPLGGYAGARLQLSFGLDALGARSAAEATALLPLSRAGTDADFEKLELSASIDQPLGRGFGLALRGRAQTSFGEVMANAEQIGIAGRDALSPLPSGTLQGDRGYVVRGELRRPFAFRIAPGLASIAPYAFAAHGEVGFEMPTQAERGATGASAWGGGIRLAGSALDGFPGISASLEYGRARVDGRAGHPDRVSFTFVTQI